MISDFASDMADHLAGHEDKRSRIHEDDGTDATMAPIDADGLEDETGDTHHDEDGDNQGGTGAAEGEPDIGGTIIRGNHC